MGGSARWVDSWHLSIRPVTGIKLNLRERGWAWEEEEEPKESWGRDLWENVDD